MDNFSIKRIGDDIINRSNININLSQLLFSLSLALDIAENRSYEHSRRTAYIAFNIAKHLGLEKSLSNEVFYASLIHDIGMTGQLASYSIKDIHHKNCLKEEHCHLGSKIVESLPLPKGVTDDILYHHENWDGSGTYGLKGDEIPLVSQIIHMADSFDINYTNILNIKLEKGNIENWTDERKGQAFSPYLTKALLEISRQDKFWLDLKFHNMHQLLDIVRPNEEISIDINGLKDIANAFALLIDNKSRFTHTHSKGVARVAKTVSAHLGYKDNAVKRIEVAGLLHDLGKLVVPNQILEKPGKLTKEEFEIIKSHPYYTKLILKQVNGLEDIAEWAGNHHEKLNGNGYPEKLNNGKMSSEDQILAVADIYQALTEDRPYRSGMAHDKAMSIMNNMGEDGYICKNIIKELDRAVMDNPVAKVSIV